MTTEVTPNPAEPAKPAAPVTPQEPVAPAAPVTPEAPAKEPASAEEWKPSGDTLVDTLAAGYIKAGGSVEQFQALLEDVGNTGSLTEGAKVELKKAFGDMAEALIPSIEAKARANLEYVTRERKAVYDAAGGESKFAEMQAWAKENLDEGTRGFLSQALNQGGKAAQLAVSQLKQLMIEGGATVDDGSHKPDGAAGGNAPALTFSEYMSQVTKLEKQGDKAGAEALRARARVIMKAHEAKGTRWR